MLLTNISSSVTLFTVTLLPIGAIAASQDASDKARSFEFIYEATIKNLPAEVRVVRVWIPVASSDQNQTVVIKKISSPVPTRITRDPVYGDRMLFAEFRHPRSSEVRFEVKYQVARKEYSKGRLAQLMHYDHDPIDLPPTLDRFLAPDRLVPVDGKMKDLAEESTRGKRGVVEKAYSLYEYVFHTMRYDKRGTGWGRGDALWACDARHGNCTDFHSIFISMARAEQIPAKFEIGFPLPSGTKQGEISGYHCWAEFYVNGPGWIPVDISEAWKDQSKHDYFFGTLDANRVQFSVGRDLTLVPKQQGAPLNYFVYPYVEVDGRPYEKLEKKFAFRDTTVQASSPGSSRVGGAGRLASTLGRN